MLTWSQVQLTVGLERQHFQGYVQGTTNQGCRVLSLNFALCLSDWLLFPSRVLLAFLLSLGRLNPTVEL